MHKELSPEYMNTSKLSMTSLQMTSLKHLEEKEMMGWESTIIL